jgi:pyridoxamine 5'-phosphate oxidase
MDDLKKHIQALREDFMRGSLDESEVSNQPSLQFKQWLQQAVDAQLHEAQAMNLATVSKDGKPSARIVYLREFENDQYWFYTNYDSKKGKELEKTPFAALTFFWPELERQVRIEGSVEKATAARSDAYYNARPYESRIGAWASQQSHTLSSRADLEKRVAELKEKYNPESIVRPAFWGGFVLKASYYEFWQGRKSRLHDRICYEADGSAWKMSRLAP